MARFVAAKRGRTPGGPRKRLAAVRAEPAPDGPVHGAEPRRRYVADAAALRSDAHERSPAVRADARRGRLARLVGIFRGDPPSPVSLVTGLRASLPSAHRLVAVLLEVHLGRGRVLLERHLPRAANLDLQARFEVRYPRPEPDVLPLTLRYPPYGLEVLRAEAAD